MSDKGTDGEADQQVVGNGADKSKDGDQVAAHDGDKDKVNGAHAPTTSNAASTNGHFDAADKLSVSYVADNFSAAIVLHPKQITQSPVAQAILVDKFVQSEFLSRAQIVFGFDPRSLEQVVLLIGSPLSLKSFDPPTRDDTPRIPGLSSHPGDDGKQDKSDASNPPDSPDAKAIDDEPPLRELFGEKANENNPDDDKSAHGADSTEDDVGRREVDFDDLFFGLEPAKEGDAADAFPFDPTPTPRFNPVAENVGVILRFAQHDDAESFLARYRFNLQEEVFQGRTYHRDVAALDAPTDLNNVALFGPLAMYSADERTVLIASEPTLRNMMVSKNAQNRLSDRLRATNAAADVIAVAIVPSLLADSEFRDGVAAATDAVGKQTDDVLEALEPLQSLTLTIRFADEALLKVAVQGNDSLPSEELLAEVKLGVDAAALALDSLLLGLADAPAEDVQQLRRLVHQSLGNAAFDVRGDAAVVVSIPTPTADELTTALKPLLTVVKERLGRRRRVVQMRQLGSAIVGYSFDHEGHFPAQASYDANGTALLSWRVHLLPYLGYGRVYDEFHLTEPWDSPHNLALLDRMPEEYGDEGSETRIMVFAGEGTPFNGTQGVTRAQIIDGQSKTIFCVRAGADKSVTWTKPGDLTFVAKSPRDEMGSIPSDGFEALFFDFNVRLVPQKVPQDQLRRLINPADGEPVDLDFGSASPGEALDR